MAKEETPKKNFFITFLIIFIVIIVAIVVWARYISTTGLIIKEYAVVNSKLPDSFNGIKIIQFSDLHYGRTTFEDDLENIVKEINLYKPDIVLFTGDLVDKDININDKDVTTIIKHLNNIETTIGKYSVKGNHDYEKDYYDNIFNETDFITLSNEKLAIYYKDETLIELYGLPSIIKEHHDYEATFKDEYDNTYFKILIAHEPDIIESLEKYNLDIMFAGHSHGGQIRLPFIGAVVKSKYAEKYFDEYYKVNNTDLYISSGIGTSQMSFRFLNKPSINLYRLYNK